MSRSRFELWVSVGILMFLNGGTISGALAQDDSITQSRTVIESTEQVPAGESASSSSTTVETRGVGFKGANVYNPKYKERIGTYSEQIEMGLNKGWLTAAEGAEFKRRLEEMKSMEAAAAANGWAKADVDKVEKVFTTFNIDLSNASNKKPSSNPAPAATPVDSVAGGESPVTKSSTTTKSTTKKKPSAKSKAKAKAKSK